MILLWIMSLSALASAITGARIICGRVFNPYFSRPARRAFDAFAIEDTPRNRCIQRALFYLAVALFPFVLVWMLST